MLEGKVVPKNTPWVVSITVNLSSTSDPVDAVHIILPSDASFTDYTLDGGFLSGGVSLSGDTVLITGLAMGAGSNASISFRDLSFSGSEGRRDITLGFMNASDTVSATVSLVVVREDTTVPLKFFHFIGTRPILIGEVVRAKGVVSAVFGNKAFVQDTFDGATWGLALYGSSGFYQGEFVVVEGEFSPYRGLEEIVYPTVRYREFVGTPQPVPLSGLNRVNEVYSGVLVSLDSVRFDTNLVWVPVGENVRIKDGANNSGLMYLDRNGQVVRFKAPDTLFNITGVVDEDSSSAGVIYRIVPRAPSDLVFYNSVVVDSVRPYYAFRNTPSTWEVFLGAFRRVEKFRVCSRDLTVSDMSGARLNSTPPSSVNTFGDTVCAEFLNTGFTSAVLSLNLGVLDADSVVLFLHSAPDVSEVYRSSIYYPRLYFTTPIREVQEHDGDFSSRLEGENVMVAGVVLADAPSFSWDNTSTYIYDGTGGVNVFSSSFYGLREGDVVVVSGTVSEYNGLTEVIISSIRFLGKDTLPLPLKLDRGEALREELEGTLVRVDTVSVSSPPAYAGIGKSFTVMNGASPITVYVYPNTGVDLSQIEPGRYVSITGIVGQYDNTPPYNSGYQLVVRKESDVQVIRDVVYEEENLRVKLGRNVFIPGRESCKIEVYGPKGRYSLRVYDGMGRLVKTVAEGGSAGIYEWDGTNSSNRKVPPGIYALVVRVVSQGKTYTAVKPIVVGAK